MDERVHNAPTVTRPDQVCKEQELSRVLGKVYKILLDLAEKEPADSGDAAAKQVPEPAVTDMTLLGFDGWEDHREHSTS